MLWAGYYNTIRLNNKYSISTDIQFRTRNWAGKWAQQLIRSGINYKLNANTTATTGFAWFRHAQYSGEDIIFKNEWRPWQELSHGIKWNSVASTHRLRLEQRFIQQVVDGKKTNSYDYTTRLRYRFELQFPIKGRVVPALVNEFMVNPGHMGSEQFLDQNRTFVGVNTKLSGATTLQLQYMKIFLWRVNNILEDQNVLRLNIVQQFNLRNQ